MLNVIYKGLTRRCFVLIALLFNILRPISVLALSTNFDFDGIKYSCEALSAETMKCKNGKKDSLVVKNNSNYIIYDQFDPPHIKVPNKVISNGQLLYYETTNNKIQDSLESQRQYAEVLLKKTTGLNDSFTQNVRQQTANYLKKTPEYYNKVKLVINNKETLSCSRDESKVSVTKTSPLKELNDLRKSCTYFSCTGNDPKEKILFYMPIVGSNFIGPSVLIMKNGQARYYDDKFTILNNSKTIISEVEKSNYIRPHYYPPESSSDFPVNPDNLIPSKYNDSKTSYNYLQSFAHGAQDPFELRSICNGVEVNNLFNEQKKIANEMKDHLAYADIVTLLTAINGNVRAAYIDREKAQTLGCSFQDKIIDYSALPELQRIESLSGAKSQIKYPLEKEVQLLFKKALLMEDIPYGYKEDGCFARAHIIARRFEKLGITVKKAWIQGSLSVPGTNLNWRYHVAPLIEAKDSNGSIVQYIIDPTLADKAVTIDEWIATMDKNVSGPVMKTTYPIAENSLRFQRTVVAISSSDAYLPMDRKILTEDEKMRNATETLSNHSDVLKSLQF